MRILAADIGGTHARFAEAETDGVHTLRLGPVFSFSTRQADIRSFGQFWDLFRRLAPGEMANPDAFDGVSLALAGSVEGRTAVLPNIDWNLSEEETGGFPNLFLLNDFVAQGYALTLGGALSGLEIVREGEEPAEGCIALVGAGTGLGHCALYPQENGGFLVAGSEAGHATFAFQGEQEKDIEKNWLELTGKEWLRNDDVVSGPGAAHLHACLHGKVVTPAEALADQSGDMAALFARFFARACRNYCLSVFPVRCLVLSGGVAIKNSRLLHSPAFLESFDDGQDYRGKLSRIPIRLNTDPGAGIRGAALYATKTLLGTVQK